MIGGWEFKDDSGETGDRIIDNFPNLVKELDIHALDVDRTPYFLNAKRLSPKCVIKE